MNEFDVSQKRSFLLGNVEKDVRGNFTTNRPLFDEALELITNISAYFKGVELINVKGREPGSPALISNTTEREGRFGHELASVEGSSADSATGKQVTRKIFVSTPFKAFRENTIVHSVAFHGADSWDAFTPSAFSEISAVRFGLELFGGSVFSRFFNFAPSVVRAIYLEVLKSEVAISSWSEVGEKNQPNEIFDAVFKEINTFSQKHLRTPIP